jgi:hypothetical protein
MVVVADLDLAFQVMPLELPLTHDQRAAGRVIPAVFGDLSSHERCAEVYQFFAVPDIGERLFREICDRAPVIRARINILAVFLDEKKSPRDQAWCGYALLRKPTDGAVRRRIPLD